MKNRFILGLRYQTIIWRKNPTKPITAVSLTALFVWMVRHYWAYVYPLDSLTIIKIIGYAAIPLAMAWAGNHLAAAVVQSQWKKRMYRIFFAFFAGLGIFLVAVVEKRLDDGHKREISNQREQNNGMSKKIDTLLDIQNRMATTKPYLAITDVDTLRQKLKDEQERTRITLDSIERRLSQIGEVHKDDLRTRTLQTSRDLLAFLYEHPCNVDSGRLSIPQIRDQEIQFFLICLESMRKAYFSTKAQAVKQIIAELQAKGLDTRHVSGLAESGWNHTVVQLLAWELAQLAEKLPKEVP